MLAPPNTRLLAHQQRKFTMQVVTILVGAATFIFMFVAAYAIVVLYQRSSTDFESRRRLKKIPGASFDYTRGLGTRTLTAGDLGMFFPYHNYGTKTLEDPDPLAFDLEKDERCAVDVIGYEFCFRCNKGDEQLKPNANCKGGGRLRIAAPLARTPEQVLKKMNEIKQRIPEQMGENLKFLESYMYYPDRTNPGHFKLRPGDWYLLSILYDTGLVEMGFFHNPGAD